MRYETLESGALGGLGGGGFSVVALLTLIVVPDRSPSYANPAIRVIITDPDANDVADGFLKIRVQPDGGFRARAEAEIQSVTEGFQYIIRVEVVEFDPAGVQLEKVVAETPRLTARRR